MGERGAGSDTNENMKYSQYYIRLIYIKLGGWNIFFYISQATLEMQIKLIVPDCTTLSIIGSL